MIRIIFYNAKKYTINIIGQNFDLPIIFKPLLSFVLVKMPYKPDIFTLRLGSLLNLPIGMNSYGVSIAVNVVKSRIKGSFSIPISIKTRMALETSRDVESFYRFQISSSNNASCNLLVSDALRIIAMEILPSHCTRENVKDIVVRTNTFISNSFQKYLINKKYSKKRQNYTEMRLKEFYKDDKRLTDEELIDLLADEPLICRLNPFKPMTLAFLTKKYFGKKEVFHSGGWPGVQTLVKIKPNDDTAVIIFTNCLDSELHSKLLERYAFKFIKNAIFRKANRIAS